jgi:multimeric flavodoxin WrbA
MADTKLAPPARYDDLKALFINCTLKRSPEPSHTDTLMDVCRAIMKSQGVSVESVRLVDHQIAFGVQPDMTEQGWDRDDWPKIWKKVEAADILVIGTPLWLGEESSVARVLIERLYAHSGQRQDNGQFVFYGKTGGCVITGNEDGVKHAAMTTHFALSHIGYTIPPQADVGWIGEVGPGLSYGDEDDSGAPAGFENAFTQRNATIMSWNLLHTARMLKDQGGFPAFGNQGDERLAKQQLGHPFWSPDS